MIWGCSLSFNDSWVEAVVDDRERDRGRMYVYTEDEAFQVGDIWFRGHFTSGNVYKDVEIGECNRFKVVGARIPLFSMYRNIIEVGPCEGATNGA